MTIALKNLLAEYDKELPYVVDDNECWIYSLTARDRNNYSIIKYRGKNYYGHVFNYVRYHGPLLPGEEVRHAKGCSRACISPMHLTRGSRQDNVDDIKEHRKEYCKHGHELNRVNSYKYNGSTICKICRSKQMVEIARKKRILAGTEKGGD